MTLDEAMDLLKEMEPGVFAAPQMQAGLVVALTLLEMYQDDIQDRGYDKEGFCQGSAYKMFHELVEKFKGHV